MFDSHALPPFTTGGCQNEEACARWLDRILDLVGNIACFVDGKVGKAICSHAARALIDIPPLMTTRPELQGDDPIELFQDWLRLAETSELNDPTAAALATASREGTPSVRMVLVKRVDTSGFRFFTNEGSQKGHELAENPQAALCFHWKTLRRQIRVNGAVSLLSEDETAEYFHSRSRRSQIGAAVSQQSRPLDDRGTLESEVAAFAEEHSTGEIPKPVFWKGYLVQPATMEFWIDGADRLHDREVFRRDGHAWSKELLYP